MKSISLCFILLLFVCFALVQASIVPPVCSYASEQANVNYTLCNFMDSDTSWCGTQVAVVPMSDPYFPCDDYLSHCVQAPPSLHANSPSCSPDPSGDPNKAKCNYLKHSVPFEIYCNTSYQSISEPVQYLALFSQDEVSFTDMQHETILYRASIYGDSTILGVSVVSPTNFTNNAYIVALTTEDIRVYFASVSYYGTFNIRPCVAQQSGIIQMDTIYDARSNTTVLVGLTRGGLATFAPINITNGCPALYTKTWQFLSPDNSVNVAQIQRIGFVSQLEPNHNQDVSYGCFPALSSRTLVYLYTPTLVFIYGYSAAAPSTNITLTAANAIYNVALISNTSNITALSIFGECFGNVNAPSQMLWLSMAVYDSRSNISSLKLVSLNEFSLSPFGCDANDSLWWARPASHRSDCGLVTTICQNKNYFVDSTGVCQSRQIGTISLNSSADHIIHRMQTTPYNTIAPAPCPDGMICILPAASPVPAPPGYYVTPRNRSIFYECAPGDWCAMSRSNVTNGLKADLNCSLGTFCGITNVTIPTPCVIKQVNGQNVTEYCPEGTVTPSLCAAGFYCPTPFQQLECYESYYCPNGSIQMDLCPGGYYCPTPTEKIKCPSGHYCREASIAPQKCHPLVLCPAGTVNEKFAVSGVLFDIGVVVVLLGGYVIGLKIRDMLRKKRDEKRAQKKRKNRKSARINLKPKTNTITFRFENLGLELHENKKKVLEGVTGTIRAGRVTAVMGPSGAGKTTFLTTLAGKAYYGTRTGKVFINDVQADIQDFKKVVGFVPQEDIMHRVLTVKEIISFNAEVRLPSSLSAQQKTDICNEVITVLGLWDIRHQPIGDETTRGISGGQRKRVNIGMELVADPTVIFLDEPTSGLDSTSSEEVVACLQRVAELGLTIVTVLHQPRYEIFQMFHDVLLLGKGGRTVYIGKSDEALGYFQSLGFKCPKHTNPPDFFMDVISGRVQREGYPDFNPTDLFDLWEQRNANFGRQSSQLVDFVSVNSHEDDDLDGAESAPLLTNAQTNKDANRKTAGFFKQLFLFTSRALVQQTRDLRGFFWDNVLIVIAGSLLGALYIDQPYKGPVAPALAALCPSFIANVCALPQTDKLNAMGSLVSLSIGFTAMAASLRCFGTEKVVFWRESAAGINKVAYFLGKNIAQLVNITLAPLVFLSIFYTLTSPRAPLWTYYETLLLLQFAVVGVGYFVSIVLTYSNAQLTGVVIALVWAMFGGANPPLKELKQNILMHIAASLSPYRWSQEALYISEITRYDEIYDVETSVAYWGFDLNNRDNDLIALLAYGLVARLFALICLMVLNRDKML